MREDLIVEVDSVSKKFCHSLKKSLWYGARDIVREITGRAELSTVLRADEFWAIHDISLELKRGESLALVGPNGAGKSTLLKMINGLIKPDKGSISVRGQVGALIELGAGFNPLLTGRENIYINAAILGLSKKEVNKRLDGIIDFAQLDEFIDAPVQNYSSGMRVRLGFSIAAHLNPDILLVDEVLAVGDMQFRTRCQNHIWKLIDSGVAVIFVSHNLYLVQALSQKAVLMEKGRMVSFGMPVDIINLYEEKFGWSTEAGACVNSRALKLNGVSITVNGDERAEGGLYKVNTYESFKIIVGYEVLEAVAGGIQIGMLLKDAGGHRVTGFTTKYTNLILPGKIGEYNLCIDFQENYLLGGNYYITLSAFNHDYTESLAAWEPAANLHVTTPGANRLEVLGDIIHPHRCYLI